MHYLLTLPQVRLDACASSKVCSGRSSRETISPLADYAKQLLFYAQLGRLRAVNRYARLWVACHCDRFLFEGHTNNHGNGSNDFPQRTFPFDLSRRINYFNKKHSTYDYDSLSGRIT